MKPFPVLPLSRGDGVLGCHPPPSGRPPALLLHPLRPKTSLADQRRPPSSPTADKLSESRAARPGESRTFLSASSTSAAASFRAEQREPGDRDDLRGLPLAAGPSETQADAAKTVRQVRGMSTEGELRRLQCVYQPEQHKLHMQVQTVRGADSQETIHAGESTRYIQHHTKGQPNANPL